MNACSAALALALAFFLGGAAANTSQSDADVDARVHALAQQIRCVVCQNQTLADSNAELAVDLRKQMRQQLVAGNDEQAVKDYLVQRYGDFVLYKPPLKPVTWLLWFGPLLLLVLVVWMLVRSRRANAVSVASELNPRERERLDAMLLGDSRGPLP